MYARRARAARPAIDTGDAPSRPASPADPRLAALAVSVGPFFVQTLGLDDAGNRTTIAEPLNPHTPSTVLDYDAQHRLRRASFAGLDPGSTVYGYSPNGHRLSVAYDGAAPIAYGYDGARRQTGAPVRGQATTCGYDPRGNQVSRQGGDEPGIFRYDGAHRLARAIVDKAGTTTTVDYRHDGDGLRVVSGSGGAFVRAVWDVNRALPVVLEEGDRLYLYGAGDAPIARANRTGPEDKIYYHRDGVGSTRVTTRAENGATANACDYDPFGAPYDLDVACPAEVAFAVERRDGATGQYQLRARQYDPHTGRFTQPDPTGYAGGPNLYAYAANNPATYTDPTGLSAQDPLSGRPYVQGRLPGMGGDGYGQLPLPNMQAYRQLHLPGMDGLEGGGQIGFAGGYSLPAYAGKKTSGTLQLGLADFSLVSGRAGPASSLPRGTRGMHNTVRTHVEAHAAALMRQTGAKSARLYINRVPCSNARPGGCEELLPRMLPGGASLEVYGPGGFHRIYRGLPE